MPGAIAAVDIPFTCTSVHTKETTGQLVGPNHEAASPDIPDAEKYRARWLRQFPDLLPEMMRLFAEHDVEYGSTWVDRFEICRTWAWYVRDMETESMLVHSNSCRLRWCCMCAEKRANYIAYVLREFFNEQSQVRLLTLTQKHRDLPVKDEVHRLKESFGKLRRSRIWNMHVTGCFWALQVKWSDKTKGWHPHYHILLTGSYIPQQSLSEKWQQITGDSSIVDIRQVHDRAGLGRAVGDIVRYVGRPANLLEIPIDWRPEVIRALDKIRLCGTTGICMGISLRPKKIDRNSPRWTYFGSCSTVDRLAAQGNKDAQEIVHSYRTGRPHKSNVTFKDVDDFIEDKFTGLTPVGGGRDPPAGFEVEQDSLLWD